MKKQLACLVLIFVCVLTVMVGCKKQKSKVPSQKPAIEQPSEQKTPGQSLKEHSFFVASEKGVKNSEPNEEVGEQPANSTEEGQWESEEQGKSQQEQGEQGEGEYFEQEQEEEQVPAEKGY